MREDRVIVRLVPVLVTILVLYVNACVEVQPPSDAVISCSNTEDCPNGWTCKDASEDEMRCVLSSGIGADLNAPTLQGTPVISPKMGNDGTRFTVCFSASERLSSEPNVSLNGGAGIIVLEAAESKPEACADHQYVYQWTASADKAAAGTHPLTVTLIDEALNKAEGLSLGTITLDFAPPDLSSVNLSHSAANGDEAVTLELVFNETLNSAPQVTLNGTNGDSSLSWTESASDDNQTFVFTYAPTGDEEEDIYTFTIGAEDAAGHVLEETLVEKLELDFTKPVFEEAPTIDPNPIVGPGDLVEVQFTLSADESFSVLPSLSVMGNSDGVTPPAFSEGAIDPVGLQEKELFFTYTVRLGDCAGEDRVWDLILSGGKDLAGNEMESTPVGTLQVDCQAPSLNSFCIYPPDSDPAEPCPDNSVSRDYALGQEAILKLALSETSSTHVTWNGDPFCLAQDADGGMAGDCCVHTDLEVICSRLVQTGDGEWNRNLFVELSDARLNQDTLALGSVFIDAVPPSMVGATIAPNPANAASQVEISFSFSEPVGDVILTSDIPLEYIPTMPQGQTYLYMMDPGHTPMSGSYPISLSTTDRAGNPLTEEIGPLVVDADFPVVRVVSLQTTAGLTPPRVKVGDTLSFDIDTDGRQLDTLHVSLGSQSLDTACEAFQEYDSGIPDFSCSYVVQESNGAVGEETSSILTVSGTDGAGNTTIDSETIIMDYKPPTITSTQLNYRPSPLNVLNEVWALALGSTVELTFTTDEISSVSPNTADEGTEAWAECGAVPEVLTFESIGENTDAALFRYGYTLTDSHEGALALAELDCPVFVGPLEDLVGNRSEQFDLSQAVEVDTSPLNAETSITDMDLVKHLRIPFGAHETGGEPAQYVVGSSGDPLTIPAKGGFVTEEVVALSAFDQGTGGNHLGVLRFDDEAPLLSTQDLKEVYLAAVDRAGNESPDRLLVPAVEWVTTPNGRTSAASPNPTQLIFSTQAKNPLSPGSEIFTGNELAIMEGSALAPSDGVSWQRSAILPEGVGVPVARTSHAMVYDTTRQVTVLFGGRGETSLQDTWEFDGTLWREVAPLDPEGDGVPEGRYGLAMIYDSARGVSVLFGGTSGLEYSDTWEYDGTSWRKVFPTDPEGDGNPKYRMHHALAYDSSRGITILYGGLWNINSGLGSECAIGEIAGVYPYCYYQDLWEYDGLSWRKITPTDPEGDGNPPHLVGHTMAYDASRKVTVLFGGVNQYIYNDVWEYDGLSWRYIPVQDPELDGNPDYRTEHTMVYDSARQRIIMQGGQFAAPFADTWEFDGNSWTEITPATPDGGPESNVNLPDRYTHSMVYDMAQDRVIIFGGTGQGVYLGDTWKWDGTRWQEVDPVHPENTTTPEERWRHGLAYDSNRKVAVLFGGINASNNFIGDTWEYDGTQWIEKELAHPEAPYPRLGHALSYHADRQVSVLFSGIGYHGFEPNTWEYDGNTWENVTPADTHNDGDPAPRIFSATAYDAFRGVTILFGGDLQGNLSSFTMANDTWEYNDDGWHKIVTADSPPARIAPALVYDPARQVAVLFGGWDGGDQFSDTWEYDGTNWQEVIPTDPEGDGNPDKRIEPAAVYDPELGRVLLFGGYNGSVKLSDTWTYDGNSWEELAPTDPEADGNPSDRQAAFMVYDTARQVSLFFGGKGSGLPMNDTWELAFASSPRLMVRASIYEETGLHTPQIDQIRGIFSTVDNGGFTDVHMGLSGQWQRPLPQEVNAYTDTASGSLVHEIEINSPARMSRMLMGNNASLTASISVQDAETGAYGAAQVDYAEWRINYRREQRVASAPFCGDGIAHPHLEEICDDGNGTQTDYCDDTCEIIGYCGDGIIQEASGEICDGNTATSECISDCRYTIPASTSVGPGDGGSVDSGSVDSGSVDSGSVDSGSVDAGPDGGL